MDGRGEKKGRKPREQWQNGVRTGMTSRGYTKGDELNRECEEINFLRRRKIATAYEARRFNAAFRRVL